MVPDGGFDMVKTYMRRVLGLILCEIYAQVYYQIWADVSNHTTNMPIGHIHGQMLDDLQW